MSVYDNIAAGKYKQTGEYPSKPLEPLLLKKSGRDLTDEEIRLLPQARQDHIKAKAAHQQAVTAWRQRDFDLVEQFWIDVAEDEGWDRSDKFVQKMESLAWERGHSGGFNDVLCALSDLHGLYEIYQSVKDKLATWTK